MEPKRKLEKRPAILATVLTDKQWEEGMARLAKTIEKHKRQERAFLKANPGHKLVAPTEEPFAD